MIGGTSIAVPPQALAQQGREQEQSAPDNQRDSDNPLRSRPVVANPRPDPKPAESSGVPNYEIDPDTGRTIWSIEEPAIDIAESDVEVSKGKPVPVPKEEIPEGFVPGESVYLLDMSDEHAHVFLNPDSTLTVTYTELPSVIDEQTGLPATESTELKSSPRGWEIATSNGKLTIPDSAGKAPEGPVEPLAEFDVAEVGKFVLNLRGQSRTEPTAHQLPQKTTRSR